jgi:hypothetical protein
MGAGRSIHPCQEGASPSAGQQRKIDSYKIITRWHVQQLAYLLGRLR